MMNVQSNLQMTGAAPGSVAAGKGNAAKVTDAERPFEARFEECCKGDKDAVSRGAQQEPEPDTQEGEKRPKLADAELTDGNADTLLVDSVADEKRDGINDAMQGTMLPDTQPMDPRLLLQFVSAASGSVAAKEGANIPVQGDATAKLSGLVRATLGTDQAQQPASGAGAQPVSELKSLSEGRVSPQLAVSSATSGSVAAVEGANNSVHSEVSAKFSGLVRRALPSDPAQQPASSSGAQAMAEAKSLSEGRVSPQLAVQSKQGLAEKPVQGALPNGQVAANVVEADAPPRRPRPSQESVSARSSEVSVETPKLAKAAVRMVQPATAANSPGSPLSRAASFGGEGDAQKGDSNSSASMQTSQQVKMDAAATQKAETVRVFIHRIDSALHALRQETNSVVQLRVNLAQGEVIKLRLSLRGTKLKTSIQADNEQTRSLLRSSWPEVSKALAGKGIDAQSFEFEQSTGDGARKDQAFAGGDEDFPFSASTGGFGRSDSEAQRTSVAITASERTHQSRFFSRIA